LTSLPESFGDLKSLQTLYLNNNQLITLPESFGNLKFLTTLRLEQNQLKKLPSSLAYLSSITVLVLRENKLQMLPEEFDQLITLKKLELQFNELTKLPESFGNLKSLSELKLENNKLSKLPASFGYLTTLNVLELTNNQLENLPESFGDLSLLNYLSLSNNKLITLPESFGNLKNLKSLYLRNNQIIKLPESFGNLKSLHILKLESNKLSKLPASFGYLTTLNDLSLKNNQLKTLPDNFGDLSLLNSLNLVNNKFITFPESFGNLQNLGSLNLQDNQIIKLPDSIGKLIKLIDLNIKNNQIVNLPESIGRLKNLKTLILINNQLTELPESMKYLSSLNVLNMEGNPLERFPNQLSVCMNLRIFKFGYLVSFEKKASYKLKMSILGAENVGKSSFLNVIYKGTFEKDYTKTIGANIFTADLQIKGRTITLSFWLSHTGSTRFKFLISTFIRGASGVLLLFDLTKSETFKQVEEIFKLFSTFKNIPIFLIGNKADLVNERQINYQDIKEKIRELKKKYTKLTGGFIPYFEISALKQKNIETISRVITSLPLVKAIKDTEVREALALLQEDLDFLEDSINYLPESDEKYLARAEYADITDYVLAFLIDNIESTPDFLNELIGELEFSKCREVTDYISKYQIKIVHDQFRDLILQEQALLQEIYQINDEIKNIGIRYNKLEKNPLIPKKRREWKFQQLKKLRQQITSKSPAMTHVYPNRENRKIILNQFLDAVKTETGWCVLEFIHAGPTLGVIFLDYNNKIELHQVELDAIALDDIISSLGEQLNKSYELLNRAIYDFSEDTSDEVIQLIKNADSYIKTYSKRLYELIPVPIQRILKSENYENLIIIPHKQLHSLIWELVHDGDDYWGLKYSISRNFSLDLTRLVLDKRRKFDSTIEPFRTLFVGNPNAGQFLLNKIIINGEPKISRIPLELKGSEKEIELISSHLNKYTNTAKPIILLREAATETNFKTALKTNLNLIHFAGHGTWTGDDPNKSYLLFHCHTEEVEDFKEEEVFRATELASSVRFKNPLLLVLSACESGKSALTGGDEFFGLIRGAILAGATSIIVSNWMVFDRSTHDLMDSFYSQIYKGKSIGIALRDARRNLYQSATSENYDYREAQSLKLLHWASFTVFGDPFQKFSLY
ncbi:MAG: CHAT domain-containing protein, partial [Promethearchaeota archaeon]